MLKNIKFDGFDIVSSSFSDNSEAEGGRYRVSIEGFDFSSDRDENGNCWAQIEFTPCIQGYPEGDDDPDEGEEPSFELRMELVLAFDIVDGDPVNEAFLIENSWFFENFMSISLKLAAESTLKFTPLRELSLPWHAPGPLPTKE